MDESYQKRFFPVVVTDHLGGTADRGWWYWDYWWYNNTVGNLDCCSATFCSMHYVSVPQMHELEYYVYNVHPFGFNKYSNEKLPRKLGLTEIITASDIKGWGNQYVDHKPVHYLDPDEVYT
jgi:hypothetical protein